MFSNIALHQKAGTCLDPLSDRIKQRSGFENFSQFDGAEMIAKKYGSP
jgi:acetyl-CoA C-acetyltransferase